MISVEEFEEILKLYKRHGWEIGRVLASRDLKPLLSSSEAIVRLGNRVTYDSDIDAIWFFRSRSNGDISWEIRLLSSSPFALCEAFPPEMPEDRIEQAKRAMEDRLRGRSSKKNAIT